ncbi:MAG: undecaprenyldiphospho-muramoylpentapeptide beta-N-acetylglucosaminyltransferase [Pseudomonadales bacterium]|nr:undecaprenyldiphospho-muramoylpentapeptide beta-N-acetylglucosaminyltransferase [Pseudomonadales bacterium]
MSRQPLRRVLVMAGGTGGHVFPALAVAKAFQEQGTEIKWLGTQAGIESRIVPENGIDIFYLDIAGVRGQGIKRLILAPIKISLAILKVLRLIKQFKPDLVLGMGGFVTGPGGVGAWLSRTPLCIHEQNAVAGFTNKILAKFSAMVFEAFPSTFVDLNHEVRTTGNPVRREIADIDVPKQRFVDRQGPIRVLILGGSQGAVALNSLVPEAFAEMKQPDEFEIRHQAGGKNLEVAQQKYKAHGLNAEVLPFIDDMQAAYSWADVVICRSGALTVAELAAAGVGSLLVPYPYAVDDHQTKNGEYLANNGAAILIQQQDLTATSLKNLILEHFLDRSNLLRMAEAARNLALIHATDEVLRGCEEVVYA